MASLAIGSSSKPADFTITIAYQDGSYFVYPDTDIQWEVYTGTTIQYVNTTGENVKVFVDPNVYQGANPFTIAPNSRTICTVILLSGNLPKDINQVINVVDGPRVASGGPRMVPTEPKER